MKIKKSIYYKNKKKNEIISINYYHFPNHNHILLIKTISEFNFLLTNYY